jgi:hypothetical protein
MNVILLKNEVDLEWKFKTDIYHVFIPIFENYILKHF